MGTEPYEPELRPFVLSLLVAAAGDPHALAQPLDLVHNEAFRHGVELAGDVPGLSLRALAGDRSFGGWLDAPGSPDDFFLFCGALLDAVDSRVRGGPAPSPRADEARLRAHEHSALLALGQTLCRAAGVRRGSLPPLSAGWRRLSAARPRELQEWFLMNYLGNILQDYFDAAEVRAVRVSFPVGLEESLRKEEAADIARAVFSTFSDGNEPVAVSQLQEELSDIIGRIWIAQKQLDA